MTHPTPRSRARTAEPLSAPPRLPGGLVVREALCAQIDEALAGGALWLWGPAGAGKTVAVAQWLAQHRAQARWLRLERGDHDPGVLLARCHAAFGRTGAAQPLPYGAEHSDDFAGYARYAAQVWAERQRRAATWVIDQAEEADPQRLGALLASLIEAAPSKLRLVVIARHAPAPALVRAVAHGQLAVLGPSALRFDGTEATALLRQRVPRLAAPTCERLVRELDGWAVGLAFAAQALRSGAAAQTLSVQMLDEPTLAQYVGDVLRQLDASQRTVLQATALLPSFTAQDVQALCALPEPDTVLNALHRQSGLLEVLATHPPRYRLHAVIRHVLRADIERQPTAERARLQRASAARRAAAGAWLDAAELLAGAQAATELLDLLQAQAPRLLEGGCEETLLEMTQVAARLPVLRNHARRLLWQARAQAVLDPAAARDAALAAVHAGQGWDVADAAPGEDPRVAAVGLLLALHRAARVSVPAPLALAQDCLARCEALWRTTAPTQGLTLALAWLHAQSVLNNGIAWDLEARRWLFAVLRADGPATQRLALAQVLYEQSYVREDAPACQEVEALARQLVTLAQTRAGARRAWLVALTAGLVYQRRLDEALACIGEAASLVDALGDLSARAPVHAWHIIVLCRSRRAGQAQALELSGEPGFDAVAPLTRATLLWAEGNLHLALQQHEVALARFDAAIEAFRQTGTNVEQGPMIWLGRSLAALLLGRRASALETLAALRASAIGGLARQRLDAFAALIEAGAALQQGDPALDAHLAQAFAALRATDYREVMHGGEPLLAELCARALRLGIEEGFVEALVRHRALEAPVGAPWSWPYPVRLRALDRPRLLTAAAAGGERGLRTSQDLLLRLLLAAPQPVAVDALIAALWPGDGREGAQKAFEAALHRLRRRLGMDGAVRLVDRRLSLHLGLVGVDVLALEPLLATAVASAKAASAQADAILELYREHFLVDDPDAALAPRRAALWRSVEAALQSALASDGGTAGRRTAWEQRLAALRSQAGQT